MDTVFVVVSSESGGLTDHAWINGVFDSREKALNWIEAEVAKECAPRKLRNGETYIFSEEQVQSCREFWSVLEYVLNTPKTEGIV